MALPNPPYIDRLEVAAATAALQKWLWTCLAAGWDPTDPATTSTSWSHDDNMEASRRGWMIAQPPGNNIQHVDLFSLKRGTFAHSIMEQIIKGASVDPLCAKAVTVLSAQKLRFPNQRFAFEKPE